MHDASTDEVATPTDYAEPLLSDSFDVSHFASVQYAVPAAAYPT